MNITRVYGIFAAVFAIVYSIAFEWHWELFSYHPRLGEFGWGRQPIKQGPVMHWYGAMATGLIAALLASAAALPFVQKRQPPLWLGWLVPLVCMVVWMWLLRSFFTR
jgi:hypothetical protein